MVRMSDNVVPFPTPPRFDVEFDCVDCGDHIFAVVHHGPALRCAACSFGGLELTLLLRRLGLERARDGE